MKIDIKTKLPGPKVRSIFKDGFKKHLGVVGVYYPFIYGGNGSGCYVEDIDGNTFLDMSSQVAVLPLGYNHPRLCKVTEKYAGKSPVKGAGQDFYVIEHLELAEELVSITPERLDAVFFSNSGAESIENAIKIAYKFKECAKIGISCEGAFHGRTLGALSLTNSKSVHKDGFPEIPVKRIPFCIKEEYLRSNIRAVERIFKQETSPKNIAYLIVEVVQGEGGYNIENKEYLKYLREKTLEYNIPLIIDEVQTGLGRTGKWWSYEHYDIEPDILTMAKALQVGATVANREYFPKENGVLSNTWGGGDMIDLAIGKEIIRTIKEDNLIENAKNMGKYALKRLKEIEETYNIVKNARGLGLMLAIDFDATETLGELVQRNYKKGMLTLPCGDKTLRMLPPLIVSEEEINIAMQILEDNIKQIESNL